MANINLEQLERIIGYNLLTNELFVASAIDYLQPSYFQNRGVKLILKIISEFYKKRETLPNTAEIRLYLDDDSDKILYKETINSFKVLQLEYNIEELVENTENFIKQKSIYDAVKNTIEEYSNGKIDPLKTFSTFETACNISLVQDLGTDYFEQIDKHIESLKETNKYIKSLWKKFDINLGGGFLEHGRSLYLFTGQPNIGKSIFLGNVAANIASQCKTVVLITLEMSENMYAKRTSSYLSKIKIKDVVDESEKLKEFLENFKKQNKNSKIIFKEFAPKSVTQNNINAYIKKLISKGIKPEAIVIDYLGLVKAIEGDNAAERLTDVTERMRAMSYMFKCSVISAMQLKKESYGHDAPELEDTKGSGGIPETADVIASIYQEEGDKDLGIIKIKFIKNRYGKNGEVIPFKIDYDTLSLEEVSEYFEKNDNTAVQEMSDILDKLDIKSKDKSKDKP